MATDADAPPDPFAAPIPAARLRRVDDRGRLIRFTAEERRARAEAWERFLAEEAARPDVDPPGTSEAMMRGIDEGRPDRPLFREYY